LNIEKMKSCGGSHVAGSGGEPDGGAQLEIASRHTRAATGTASARGATQGHSRRDARESAPHPRDRPCRPGAQETRHGSLRDLASKHAQRAPMQPPHDVLPPSPDSPIRPALNTRKEAAGDELRIPRKFCPRRAYDEPAFTPRPCRASRPSGGSCSRSSTFWGLRRQRRRASPSSERRR